MESATVTYKVGEEIFRPPDEKTKWLVVRLIERDTSLVVNDTGQEFITTESYVMLKSEHGEIDFVILLHDDVSFARELSRQVSSLPSLWRKHNGNVRESK